MANHSSPNKTEVLGCISDHVHSFAEQQQGPQPLLLKKKKTHTTAEGRQSYISLRERTHVSEWLGEIMSVMIYKSSKGSGINFTLQVFFLFPRKTNHS